MLDFFVVIFLMLSSTAATLVATQSALAFLMPAAVVFAAIGLRRIARWRHRQLARVWAKNRGLTLIEFIEPRVFSLDNPGDDKWCTPCSYEFTLRGPDGAATRLRAWVVGYGFGLWVTRMNVQTE